MSSSQPRRGTGRRKLSMEKIGNPSNLQVTFSKRRAGLFKKANELCTLTGAEAAVVVFSPTDKPYSFGHPNVDTIVDRFTHQNSPYTITPTNNQLSQFQGNSNERYSNLERMLEAERKRGEELDRIRMAPGMRELFASNEELDPQQFDQIYRDVQNFESSLDRSYVENAASHAMSSYYGGSVVDPNFRAAGGSSSVAKSFLGSNFSVARASGYDTKTKVKDMP